MENETAYASANIERDVKSRMTETVVDASESAGSESVGAENIRKMSWRANTEEVAGAEEDEREEETGRSDEITFAEEIAAAGDALTEEIKGADETNDAAGIAEAEAISRAHKGNEAEEITEKRRKTSPTEKRKDLTESTEAAKEEDMVRADPYDKKREELRSLESGGSGLKGVKAKVSELEGKMAQSPGKRRKMQKKAESGTQPETPMTETKRMTTEPLETTPEMERKMAKTPEMKRKAAKTPEMTRKMAKTPEMKRKTAKTPRTLQGLEKTPEGSIVDLLEEEEKDAEEDSKGFLVMFKRNSQIMSDF